MMRALDKIVVPLPAIGNFDLRDFFFLACNLSKHLKHCQDQQSLYLIIESASEFPIKKRNLIFNDPFHSIVLG